MGDEEWDGAEKIAEASVCGRLNPAALSSTGRHNFEAVNLRTVPLGCDGCFGNVDGVWGVPCDGHPHVAQYGTLRPASPKCIQL